MSQPGSGSAVELSNKIQSMQRSYAPPDNLDSNITGGPEFAARYFQRTKEEEAIDLKQQFVRKTAGKMQGAANGADGQVLVTYSPSDSELDVIKRKQAQGVQYAFHNFVKSMVRPDKSFVNAKYFADHFPDILQKELEEVDTKFEQLKRLAKILIRNQINQEDAAYLFSIASLDDVSKQQYIDWLKHPVFLPWDKTTQTQIHQYGKLNPKRFIGRVTGAATPETLQSYGEFGYGMAPEVMALGKGGQTLFRNGTGNNAPGNVGNMLTSFFS